MKFPNKIVLLLIGLYQSSISIFLPRSCRFTPSCSEYGKQAFGKFPFLKASRLTLWRILRCNPFCRGGYDPLP